MKILIGEIVGNLGDVVDVVYISDSVGSFVIFLGIYEFSIGNFLCKVLYVFILEEFGFDLDGYEL